MRNSIESTARISGVDPTTITKARLLAGERSVQCDEIWGYVPKKEPHKTPMEAYDKSIGDAYCFVAIERNTKFAAALAATAVWYAASVSPYRVPRTMIDYGIDPDYSIFHSERDGLRIREQNPAYSRWEGVCDSQRQTRVPISLEAEGERIHFRLARSGPLRSNGHHHACSHDIQAGRCAALSIPLGLADEAWSASQARSGFGRVALGKDPASDQVKQLFYMIDAATKLSMRPYGTRDICLGLLRSLRDDLV